MFLLILPLFLLQCVNKDIIIIIIIIIKCFTDSSPWIHCHSNTCPEGLTQCDINETKNTSLVLLIILHKPVYIHSMDYRQGIKIKINIHFILH